MAEETKVHRVKKTRRVRTKQNDISYFLVITMVCLVVALAVAFVIGRGPSILGSIFQKEEAGYVEKLRDMKDVAAGRYSEKDINDLIKEYRERKNTSR